MVLFCLFYLGALEPPAHGAQERLQFLSHPVVEQGAEPRKAAEGPSSGSLTDWTTVKSGNAYEGEDGLESSIASDLSLKDHLESQLSIAALLPEAALDYGLLMTKTVPDTALIA